MRQRHLVVGIAVVCLAGMIASVNVAGQDETCIGQTGCRNHMNSCESLLRGGEVRKGVVIFRIAYDGDVEDVQKKAFRIGMEKWNKHRETTGFAFEDAKIVRGKDGRITMPYDFRLQKGAPRHFELADRANFESAKCAVYEPLTSR